MKDNVKDKRGGKCSMKKRLNRIKALVLAMAMLVSVFQGVPGVQIFDWSKNSYAKRWATHAKEYDGLNSDVRGNCVGFVRTLVSDMPGGLWTANDKRNIINSNTPVAGAVAIEIENGSNHVAYVESVNGNIITTLDGGWGGGYGVDRKSTRLNSSHRL